MEEGSVSRNGYSQILPDPKTKNQQSKATPEPDIETPMIDPEQNVRKQQHSKFKTKMFYASVLFVFIVCLAGGIALLVLAKKSEKTGIENQCSGYSTKNDNGKPNGKAYLNCYNLPPQCQIYHCTENQCLESKFGIYNCVPPNYGTYFDTSSDVMIVFGIILIGIAAIAFAILFVACRNKKR